MSGRIVPGSVVAGRYRLGSLLGSGGMGVVYEAVDLRDGATLALKLLPFAAPNRTRTREDQLRFEREAAVAGLIEHPAIVPVHDSGRDGALAFIAMERLHGADLRSHLSRSGPLAPADAARIARVLCGAVAAAHAAGVVHRDIKPANIFLGDDPHCPIRVLDFGIAKWLDAGLELTGPSQVLGTPAFMAPELLMSSREATPAADIYAIGATLYAMLSGQPPFCAKSEAELHLMVAYDEPPRVEHPALDTVIQRAMAKNPELRHPSAIELGNAL